MTNCAPDRPNILLILTEQQRGDAIGCDGHPVLLTPTMDDIASNGARLSRFYSDCPVCMPARRTLLSGQYPATHGLLGNADGTEWNPAATLAGVLRDHGYQTRWIGRGMHQFPKHTRFGFDEVEEDYAEWLADHAPAESGGHFGAGVMHNDWTARPWPLPEYMHHTNWTVQRALSFLSKRDPTCPFFLTLSFSAAHPPLQPPACYFERYVRTGVPEPHIGDWAVPPDRPHGPAGMRVDLRGEALLSARAAYYGLINHLDDQLRRLLNPVIGIRHRADTIVCLTSDHGEMLGDHYRWHKTVAYEGAARIPFLLSAPEAIGVSPGTVIDAPATLADVMPTLLDMAGVSAPDTMDGISLLPLLKGQGTPDRACVHIEHAGRCQALTDGLFKYIWHPTDGTEQLFDLRNDPGELRDLGNDPQFEDQRIQWRQRLVARLNGRPEGFSDGKRLIAGRSGMRALPHAGPKTPFARTRFAHR